MNALIIGASTGLGRALCEALASTGYNLYLVSSDKRDLIPLSSDLNLRFNIRTFWQEMNLKSTNIENLYQDFFYHFSELDALFIVAGMGDLEKDFGPIPETVLKELIAVNFFSPVQIINCFLPHLKNKKSNIVAIGSVAATRPRKNNAIYGTSKRALEFYFGTLRHYLYEKDCKIQFYRLGYISTQMNFEKKLSLPAVSPSFIANKIIKNLNQNIELKYLPSWWLPIMFIFKWMPWFIFKRINV